MSWKVQVLVIALLFENVFSKTLEFSKSEEELMSFEDNNGEIQVGDDKAAENFITAHTMHRFSSEFISTLYYNLSKGMNLGIASADPIYGVHFANADTVRTLPTSACRLDQKRWPQLVATFNVSTVEENSETIHGVQLRIKTGGSIRTSARTFIAATTIGGSSSKSFVSTVELVPVTLQPDQTWVVDVTRFYLQWHNFIKTQNNQHNGFPFFGIVLADPGRRKSMTKSKLAKRVRRLRSSISSMPHVAHGTEDTSVCSDVILVMYTETGEFMQQSSSSETLVTRRLISRRSDRLQESGRCRRVAMDVEFPQLGWGHWVVYPNRFNAYKCSGYCSGYMAGTYSNLTNHALVQSLMRLMTGNGDIPAPCCIPTKLSPMSVLYHEKGGVVIKYHEDMVIDECGCA